jgi:hypothetical protein
LNCLVYFSELSSDEKTQKPLPHPSHPLTCLVGASRCRRNVNADVPPPKKDGGQPRRRWTYFSPLPGRGRLLLALDFSAPTGLAGDWKVITNAVGRGGWTTGVVSAVQRLWRICGRTRSIQCAPYRSKARRNRNSSDLEKNAKQREASIWSRQGLPAKKKKQSFF